MPVARGARLGPYAIGPLLGRGGMGEVYRATDERLLRDVAIKILSAEISADPAAKARLEREARAIAALNHPNICTLHDVGHEGDVDFLVMEFIDGETLSARLAAGPLPVAETLRIAGDVTDALAAAHAKGLIHRDIKPSNVVITKAGRVKVVDFGLARPSSALPKDDELTRTNLTSPGTAAGTPFYMSPEQTLGQPLDHRTDIFSLGVVIYKCLSGRLPFDGDTLYQYVPKMLAGAYRPIEEFCRDLPSELPPILARCLAVDPDARINSAAWLRAELQRVGREGLSGGVAKPAVEPRPKARPGPVILAAAGLTLAAIGGVLAWKAFAGPGLAPNISDELIQVAASADAEFNARISPKKDWISYIASAGRSTALRLKSLSGGDPMTIKTSPGHLLGHVWSPDGSEIAYLVRAGATTRLEIVSAFGGGSPRLSSEIRTPVDPDPIAWTTTGIFIQAPPRLHRFDESSRQLHEVTSGWSLKPTSFAVRSDGKRVAFSAPTSSAPAGIWTSALDGTDVVAVTTDQFTNRFPIWQGDDAIVYASNRGSQVDLFRITSTGDNIERLTTTADRELPEAASSDGSIVVFQQTAELASLVSINTATGSEIPLTPDAAGYYWPAASSGSSALAYQRVRPVHRELIYRLLDTDVYVATLTERGFASSPRLVGDGFGARLAPGAGWVAYLRWSRPSADSVGITAVNLASNHSVELASGIRPPGISTGATFDAIGLPLAWAPGGRELYFVNRASNGIEEIRRFTTTQPSAPSTPVIVVNDARAHVTDLWVSHDGAELAYVVRPAGHVEVHVRNLKSPDDHIVWRAEAPNYVGVMLKGWRQNDAALVAVEPANPDGTSPVRIIEIALGSSSRNVLGTADSAFPAGARYDPEVDTVYLTTAAGTAPNVLAIPLAGGRTVVTRNSHPDIAYSSLELAGRQRLIGTREQTKQDIWMIRK